MNVTLQDVATTARVSLATVSKVLNNRYDVAPETVHLVEGAIRQVGYKRTATRRGRPTSTVNPPSTVRAQRRKSVTSMALLIPATQIEAMQSPLAGQVVHGAEAVARKQGLNFHLTRLAENGHLPPCLDPIQVDGLIVRSTRAELTVPLPEIPTVWIFQPGYTPTSGDLVVPDNELIGETAARYLLQHGHQNVAAVTARLNHAEAQTRADRFVRYTSRNGATAHPIESGDIEAIADQLLAYSPRVTGLFMPLGDNLLENLYRAMQRRGVRCGGHGSGADIEIISCNNDATHLRVLDPSLPNIDICADEIGRVAADTLLWRIQHPREHRRCILIEPKLVEQPVPSIYRAQTTET